MIINFSYCKIVFELKNINSFKSLTITAPIDKTIKKQFFSIRNNQIKEPQRALLILETEKNREHIIIYLHDGNLKIIIDSTLLDMNFINSKLNDEYAEVLRTKDFYFKKEDSIRRLDIIQNHKDSLLEINGVILNKYYLNHAKHHNCSYITLQFLYFELGTASSTNRDVLIDIFDGLCNNMKSYSLYNEIQALINRKIPTTVYNTGDTINNYTFENYNDKKIMLYELLEKDYTYLEFWSYNCSFCRKSHKILNQVNKKYHPTLNIVSISVSARKHPKSEMFLFAIFSLFFNRLMHKHLYQLVFKATT